MENRALPLIRNLENMFLIDWLTVVFHGVHVDDIQSILGLTGANWESKSSFINGYPMDTFFSNIHIRWGADDPRYFRDSYDKSGKFVPAEKKARSDMGICLDLSGQGCRSFEEFSQYSWFELLDRIFKMGGRVNVTRLDLAYDDHSRLLNIWQMRRDVEDRNYISKSKKSMIIWSDDQEHDIQGLTLQIGSKSSPVLIRIYDKAAERGWGKERHWIRVELQLRQDRAQEALKLLWERESVGMVASGIIRNYCTFVIPSSDTNRSRWKIADYWERVLEGMEKLRVWVAPGEPYNFSKSENHLVHQYGQMIQAYAMIHGSVSSLVDRARAAHPDLKPKYRAAVEAERLRKKMSRDEAAALMKNWGFSSEEDFSIYKQATFAELLQEDPDLPW